MFDKYEQLKCEVCGQEFLGRMPVEGGIILCPIHYDVSLLAVISEEDVIPDDVYAEIEGGKGNE